MKVTYRVHTIRRMFERGISEADVHTALLEGEEITAYPEETSYPSRLLLGWRGDCMSWPPIMRRTMSRS